MHKVLYTFREVTDRELFDSFVISNGGSVFQTRAWAEVKNSWKPYMFMGFIDKDPIIGCLCLERKIPVLGKFWYAAEGYIGDYGEFQLLTEFTAFMKKMMRTHGVFGLCSDPLLPVKLDNVLVTDITKIENLLALGFREPKDKTRYLVQPPTDIIIPVAGKTEDELLAACEKGVRHGYKTGLDNGLCKEEYSGDNVTDAAVDIFFDVMTESADRVEFVHRTREYYKSILSSLGKDALLTLVYYDRAAEGKKHTACCEAERGLKSEADTLAPLKDAQSVKRLSEVKKQLSALDKYLRTYERAEAELALSSDIPSRLYLAAGLTSYAGRQSVCLYGGTKNILRNTLRPTHFLNISRLSESSRRGCSSHSMGRVTGDPFDESNPLAGLVAYKRSYGGKVVTYTGDLYLKCGTGFKMLLFTRLFPALRHFRATVMRKKLNKENES